LNFGQQLAAAGTRMNLPTSNQEPKRDSHRLFRFLVSTFLLMLIGFAGAGTVSSYFNASALASWALYLAYLNIQGALLSLLTSVLVSQHEMYQWKVGIKGMMIATAMIALPLGTSSLFFEIVESTSLDIETVRGDAREFTFTLTAMLYFTIVPLIFFMEALVVWISATFVHKVETRHENRYESLN